MAGEHHGRCEHIMAGVNPIPLPGRDAARTPRPPGPRGAAAPRRSATGAVASTALYCSGWASKRWMSARSVPAGPGERLRGPGALKAGDGGGKPKGPRLSPCATTGKATAVSARAAAVAAAVTLPLPADSLLHALVAPARSRYCDEAAATANPSGLELTRTLELVHSCRTAPDARLSISAACC
jgi:hypothetical protein